MCETQPGRPTEPQQITAKNLTMQTMPDLQEANLSQLPFDVLLHIATYLASYPSAALALSEAHTRFIAPVRQAIGSTVDIQRKGGSLNGLIQLIKGNIHTLKVHTPFPTDPALTAAYPLLNSEPLHTLYMRADNDVFTKLRGNTTLRALHLQMRHSHLHPLLLETLPTLQIHTLRLCYMPDFSLTHVGLACRCACYPLRAAPGDLAAAVPQIRHFSIRCSCQGARMCTLPPFANLKTAEFGGLLPSTPPGRLLAAVRNLSEFALTNLPHRAIDFIEGLAPYVTAVECKEETRSRAYSEQHVVRLCKAAPNLTRLHMVLLRDSETSLLHLPKTMRSLKFGFRSCLSNSSRDGVAFHTMDKNLFAELPRLMPMLTELEILSTKFDIATLNDILRGLGKTLKKLTVPVHAQEEVAHVRLVALFDGVISFCPHLSELEIQNMPYKTFISSKMQLSSNVEDGETLRLRFESVHRWLPFLNMRGLRSLVDQMTLSFLPSDMECYNRMNALMAC